MFVPQKMTRNFLIIIHQINDLHFQYRKMKTLTYSDVLESKLHQTEISVAFFSI